MKSKNATGFKSVYRSSPEGKTYEYRFMHKGKRYRRGGFATAVKASAAYVKAHKAVFQKSFGSKIA